jgi:hypothetical protein
LTAPELSIYKNAKFVPQGTSLFFLLLIFWCCWAISMIFLSSFLLKIYLDVICSIFDFAFIWLSFSDSMLTILFSFISVDRCGWSRSSRSYRFYSKKIPLLRSTYFISFLPPPPYFISFLFLSTLLYLISFPLHPTLSHF